MRNLPCKLFYFIILLSLTTPAFAASQAQNKHSNLNKGVFIVASDQLDHGAMRHSVIYVIQHDEAGTSGIIINRPTNLKINEAFPDTHASKVGNSTLYFGGPLHTQYLFMLTETQFTQGLFPVDHGIYFGTGEAIKMRLQADKRRDKMKTFAGFMSWGPGQLEQEIKNGNWVLAPASKESVFDAKPETIWETLYKRWAGSWI